MEEKLCPAHAQQFPHQVFGLDPAVADACRPQSFLGLGKKIAYLLLTRDCSFPEEAPVLPGTRPDDSFPCRRPVRQGRQAGRRPRSGVVQLAFFRASVW